MVINRLPAEELLRVIQVTQLERRVESHPRRMPEPAPGLGQRDGAIRVPGLRRLPVRGASGVAQAAWRL